ncbi:MAG: DUF5678 domain-containing protein [Planctomycetes bacterium]|nr:DUF5678 domain-containing protein [Planctomycetota bacterium]
MTTIRVRANVSESRQLVLTLPPEVQLGEHEFEVTVRDATSEPPIFEVTLPVRQKVFPQRPTNPALSAEFDAFERMLPELMKQYAGKYVALRNGAVVAVGDTEVIALTAAYQQPSESLVYCRLVTDQPQPIERIPSFRQLSTG